MPILNVNIIGTDIVEYSDRHVGSLERDERRCGMSKAMIISFCFGLAMTRGIRFQDVLLIIVSIIGFIVNLMNSVR